MIELCLLATLRLRVSKVDLFQTNIPVEKPYKLIQNAGLSMSLSLDFNNSCHHV